VERSTDVTIPARAALAAIRALLAELRAQEQGPHRSGQRAALWRAQHEAARRGRTLQDLRGYCLEALRHPRGLDAEHEGDYLRGYRDGLQLVLSEIRRIERRGK
jgi:hypothetical protein